MIMAIANSSTIYKVKCTANRIESNAIEGIIRPIFIVAYKITQHHSETNTKMWCWPSGMPIIDAICSISPFLASFGQGYSEFGSWHSNTHLGELLMLPLLYLIWEYTSWFLFWYKDIRKKWWHIIYQMQKQKQMLPNRSSWNQVLHPPLSPLPPPTALYY